MVAGGLIQIRDNVSGFEIAANGTPEAFELRKSPRTLESTWARTTTDAAMVTEPPLPEPKENDKSKDEKEADAKKAAPVKDEAKIQLEDNDAGLELMANGTPEIFPLRGNPKSVPSTWARGTVDMVDPNGKVADINRKMPNNPDKSR